MVEIQQHYPLVASSVASVFQTTISHPFEFIKTGLQLHKSTPGRGQFNMFHQVKWYFSGCLALNVGTLFKTITRFTMFDKACQMMKDPNSSSQLITGPRLLAASMITGFMESLWVIPFESIKTTMIENALIMSQRAQDGLKKDNISYKENNPGVRPRFHKDINSKLHPYKMWGMHYENQPSTQFLTSVKEIYLTRGIHGFIQGSIPTIFRQMSTSAIRFTTYTYLKNLISPNKQLNEYSGFFLGIISSSMVVALTQPIDVVKTRMQSKHARLNYKNSLNCAYRIFVEEGPSKFWKGWVPRLFKVGFSGGISFSVYQYVENLLLLIEHEKKLDHSQN